jgi:hypothetical protein
MSQCRSGRYGQCGDRAARRRKMLLSRRCIGRGQLSSALLADATITELLQSNGNPLTPYVLNIQHMLHLRTGDGIEFLHATRKRKSPAMRGFSCNMLPGAGGDQAAAGSAGVTGVEGERGPRAKRVASILRRSSTPCPLPVTLSTA